MYRIFKPKRFDATITIINTETHASVIIGNVNISIMNRLRDAGFSEDEINTSEEWDLEIDKDTARDLTAMAMRMKKPIRDQRKKPEEEKKVGVDIDAFDLIYGI